MDNFVQHSFLCHHGIPDMKWGVRRYQNKDGSLTSEGRIRYHKNRSKTKNNTFKTLLSTAINRLLKLMFIDSYKQDQTPIYIRPNNVAKNIIQNNSQLQMQTVNRINQENIVRMMNQIQNNQMMVARNDNYMNTMSGLRAGGMLV